MAGVVDDHAYPRIGEVHGESRGGRRRGGPGPPRRGPAARATEAVPATPRSVPRVLDPGEARRFAGGAPAISDDRNPLAMGPARIGRGVMREPRELFGNQ